VGPGLGVPACGSLASWESLFGLPRLAYAATVPTVFGADVFTAAK
jgi:hypothetical protein